MSSAAWVASRMASGAARPIVKTVLTGLGAGRPQTFQARTEPGSPLATDCRLASRSQSAQSSAFLAAPASIACCRVSRSSPPATASAWSSIAAATPSTVSP